MAFNTKRRGARMNENGGEAFNWTIRALSELRNENYREAKKFLRWALEALEVE